MIDRSEVNRALAKAIAYKNSLKDAQAEAWAAELIRLLGCAGILNPDKVRRVAETVAAGLAAKRIKPVIDKRTGAIAFTGITETERDGVTDGCIYRRLLATGSALARAEIAKAEQLAGRSVDRQAVAQGHHAHSDGQGGLTWHHGH